LILGMKRPEDTKSVCKTSGGIEKSVTYPIVIVVMLLTVGSMLAWFKKKKWL
jgi:hypothetical protein